MTFDALVRSLSLCIVLAGTETLHGIARNVLLAPRIGKVRATKVSIVSGSLLAFAVCYLLVPGIGLRTVAGHLYLGAGVALFMAGFDVAMGRLLLKRSWARAFSDFNPATGNYLIFGLALLIFFPLVVAMVRGLV